MFLLFEFTRGVMSGILSVLSALVCWFVRFVLSVYWGKGETVPRIQNPLLLKSATTLAKEIRKGQLKSEDVVLAYVHRIQEVEPFINATVECVFEDAIKKAREVDKLVSSGKYTEEQLATDKPLLGVPISIKNAISVKGLLTSVGSAFFKDLRASEDSACVCLMKGAGAIVIATTNVPECCLQLETNNFLQGRTQNPYNTSRTTGGSSGGEAALVAAGGSVLGFGNDLIGSIRLPCHFTGLFGHKPTNGLVSNHGTFPVPGPKLDSFLSTGPICRYPEDLITSMKVLTLRKPPCSMEFEKQVDFTKLKICYALELEDHLISPLDREIAASIEKAVSYFQTRYGTVAKEVRIPSLNNTNIFGMHMLLSSIDNIVPLITGGKMESINEKMDLLKYFFGKSTFSLGPLLVLNSGKLLYNKDNVPYYQEKLKKMAEEFEEVLDVDTVFFFPTFPISAPYHEEMTTRSPSIGYTGVFNFIGLPATQCPLGLDKEGLPYGMQVIGQMNNDPLTIACAVELETAFGGWIQPGNE